MYVIPDTWAEVKEVCQPAVQAFEEGAIDAEEFCRQAMPAILYCSSKEHKLYALDIDEVTGEVYEAFYDAAVTWRLGGKSVLSWCVGGVKLSRQKWWRRAVRDEEKGRDVWFFDKIHQSVFPRPDAFVSIREALETVSDLAWLADKLLANYLLREIAAELGVTRQAISLKKKQLEARLYRYFEEELTTPARRRGERGGLR